MSLQDAGPICLLDKCEPIFEELEDHQVLFVCPKTKLRAPGVKFGACRDLLLC